jgi:putative hydrolase of the HAD superfamily
MNTNNTKHILFDWGNTLMVDTYSEPGPMCDWPRVKIIPGVKKILEELQGKASLHVATNADESGAEEVRKALERVQIASYFSRIFSSSDLKVSKPSPGFFKKIVVLLNSSPEKICMIGDSIEKDVLPSIHLGMKGIWFNPEGNSVPAGIISISNMADLPEAIGLNDP